MKKILLLIFCICNWNVFSFAQDLNTFSTFLDNNFKEWKAHFGIKNYNEFKSDFENEIEHQTVTTFNSDEWKKYIKTYDYFLEYNPSETLAIDLFSSGIEITIKNGKYYGSADVDQGLYLTDMKSKKAIILAFCGPSCHFAEAKWFNDNIGIVVGNLIDENNLVIPSICVIDTKKKSIVYYYKYKQTPNQTNFYKGIKFKKIIYN